VGPRVVVKRKLPSPRQESDPAHPDRSPELWDNIDLKNECKCMDLIHRTQDQDHWPGSGEGGNEPSDSTQKGKFLDHLNNYQLLEKDSVP
jgi:hypothetical protein